MSDAPLPTPPAAGVRVGRPRDLLWLFLFGVLALLVLQSLGVFLLLSALRPHHPDLSPVQLLRLASREAEHNAFFAVPVQIALYAVLALFIYLRVRRVAPGPFWRAMAWRSVGSERAAALLLGGVVLALAIQLGTAVFPPPEPLPIERLFTSRSAALLILAASLITAPFFEELIFRGYLYGLLEPAWGVGPAVVVSGALFGLLHAPQLYPGWAQMAFLCLVGVAFSAARAHTGSLAASFLMHLAYNATISVLFLLSPDFRHLAAEPLGTQEIWQAAGVLWGP